MCGATPACAGHAVNTVNLNLIKNTRISEKVNLRLEANVYNPLNHLFYGVPCAVHFSADPGLSGPRPATIAAA